MFKYNLWWAWASPRDGPIGIYTHYAVPDHFADNSSSNGWRYADNATSQPEWQNKPNVSQGEFGSVEYIGQMASGPLCAAPWFDPEFKYCEYDDGYYNLVARLALEEFLGSYDLESWFVHDPCTTSPDLAISSISAPANATANQSFTANITTKNIGNGSAGASTTYYNASSGSTGTFSIGYLAPNATQTNSVNFTCTQAGLFYIDAMADSGAAINESNEANNGNQAIVNCLPQMPDLIIGLQNITDAKIVGQPFNYSIFTRNNGNANASSSTTNYSFSGSTGTFSIGPLAPNTLMSNKTIFNCTQEGVFNVTAIADYYSVVNESNEANNQKSFTITCLASPPDLVISNVNAPANANVGIPFTASITTKNIGNGTAGASTTSYNFSGSTGAFSIGSLAPNANQTDSKNFTCTQVGPFNLTATADSGFAIIESNEANNGNKTTVNCLPAAPDLIVSSISAPASALVGYGFDVQITTKNNGSAATGIFETTYNFAGSSPVDIHFSSLDAGTERTDTVSLVCNDVGAFNITATADSYGGVPEINESNNQLIRSVDCLQAYPDIVISQISAPANASVGQPFIANITTANIGEGPAEVPSQTNVSFSGSNRYINVPVLAPSAGYEGQVSLTCTEAGALTISATSDALGQISESNEANNNLAVNITCLGTSPSVTVNYTDGWNLLSLPVAVSNNASTAIWPEGASGLFAYISSYVTVSQAEYGKGYWMKFNAPFTKHYSGGNLTFLNTSINNRWNMVGGLSDPVNISNIKTEPAGILISEFFGYDNGYYPTNVLQPGRGYWVKTSQAGRLILNSTQPFNQIAATNTASMSSLKVSDATAASMKVYLGSTTKPELPSAMSGTFDARYTTNRYIEAPPASGYKDYNISITATNYPVKIEWKMNTGYTYKITYTSGGVLQTKTLSGTGSFSIADPTVKKVTLRVTKATTPTTTLPVAN